jgi:hypothetical protein
VAVWVSPSGVMTCSRRATSKVVSRSTSTRRPSTQKPALLYENCSPGSNSCGTSASSAMYFSRQSSPTPVSVKMSPSKPAVWLSSWRVVMTAAADSDATRNSGR